MYIHSLPIRSSGSYARLSFECTQVIYKDLLQKENNMALPDTPQPNLEKLNESLKYASSKLQIPSFRKHQEDAICRFIDGHDVFVSYIAN